MVTAVAHRAEWNLTPAPTLAVGYYASHQLRFSRA
jgi:hypothetical protein